MRKILSLLVVLFAAFCLLVLPALAADVDLTFQWEQEITLDFGGWRLYYGTNEGGPYTQFGADLVYDGTPRPTYTATETLAAPDNAETVFYFVATAYDNLGNESVYSNEVSYTADFLAPSVPVNLRVTVSTP